MAYNQKDQAGRGPMMKTGRNIPDTFKGPMAAQDGPIDDFIAGAKNVAKKIGKAHDAGIAKYRGNTTAANHLGSNTGRSYARDPINYITGFASNLTK